MDKQKLFQDHQEKEKRVIEFFNQAIEEVKMAFFAPKAPEIVGIRLQMISAFTLAEVLSNFWDSYTNQSRKPDARLTDWLNTFCMTDKNKMFKSSLYFSKLGTEPLINLRHSLIHFFGLSPQKLNKQIALGSSHMDERTFQQFSEGFISNVAVFKPIDFYNLFKDGGLLMLNIMLDNVHESQVDASKKWQHIEGINRIFQKFQIEGAIQILIPKSNQK